MDEYPVLPDGVLELTPLDEAALFDVGVHGTVTTMVTPELTVVVVVNETEEPTEEPTEETSFDDSVVSKILAVMIELFDKRIVVPL